MNSKRKSIAFGPARSQTAPERSRLLAASLGLLFALVIAPQAQASIAVEEGPLEVEFAASATEQSLQLASLAAPSAGLPAATIRDWERSTAPASADSAAKQQAVSLAVAGAPMATMESAPVFALQQEAARTELPMGSVAWLFAVALAGYLTAVTRRSI